MDRRSFLSILPATAATTAVALHAKETIIEPKVALESSLHSHLMKTFPATGGGTYKTLPSREFVLPSGTWRIIWTGYKGGCEYTSRVAQWLAGKISDDESDCRKSGHLVYVSNPGYGGILRRGGAMCIDARLGIPYAEGLESEPELERIQSYLLDVLLDMLSAHDWSITEVPGQGNKNLTVAWPRLHPKTKFYLDTHGWYEEQTGVKPENKYYFSYDKESDFVIAKSREYGFMV